MKSRFYSILIVSALFCTPLFTSCSDDDEPKQPSSAQQMGTNLGLMFGSFLNEVTQTASSGLGDIVNILNAFESLKNNLTGAEATFHYGGYDIQCQYAPKSANEVALNASVSMQGNVLATASCQAINNGTVTSVNTDVIVMGGAVVLKSNTKSLQQQMMLMTAATTNHYGNGTTQQTCDTFCAGWNANTTCAVYMKGEYFADMALGTRPTADGNAFKPEIVLKVNGLGDAYYTLNELKEQFGIDIIGQLQSMLPKA